MKELGRKEGRRKEKNEKRRILVFKQIFSLMEFFSPRVTIAMIGKGTNANVEFYVIKYSDRSLVYLPSLRIGNV